ncbi:hypothetical protein BGZ95_010849 [Linnemannia exigua]|uniref:Coth-domain-containing protein n=1 Tax=Linnemannia exigua TaxID=604196 RepID=A0AAD4DAR4_9FUNG|nr:hypothetical protein BGZ95_010849 [Linnemannia exigua]
MTTTTTTATKRTVFLGLAFVATCALADVTYNVVGYPDTETGSFGVQIDGKVTKLVTNSTTFPLWSITLPTSTSSPYKYVKLDGAGNTLLAEDFTRTLKDALVLATDFEVFDREVTDYKVPLVPLVYDPWEASKTKVFDDGVIATIHLTGDAGLWEAILMKPEEAVPMNANFRYINDKVVHSVNNITIGVSGKSSMEFNKQAIKLEFDTKQNQSFFSRPSVKLRSESSDPTMIREKLYIDVLNAVGVPTQQGAWVRVFMNSMPVGLYLMVDDIGNSFLKQTVHHGDPNVVRGSLWQMNAPVVEQQGDLKYLGPLATDYPGDCYKMKTLGSNPVEAPMTQLIQFMKALDDFKPLEMNGGKYWEDKLDVDGFLRNMAMEFLAGSWDAYWWSGSNYFFYFNPTLGSTGTSATGKWQWISTDFDGTFGDGDPTEVLTTYQAYADFSKHDRPMITKLILASPDLNKRFEQTLKDIVSYAFKPEALFPRIEAYEKMLAKDVAWDDSINRSNYPGKTNAWTELDFHKSLLGGVKDMSLGVKPWIEGRAKDLQKQLGFVVVPGTPDLAKRPAQKSKGGLSDEEAYSSGSSAGPLKVGKDAAACRWVVVALTALGALICALF